MEKKYVLVTGSSRGIGRACALAFAGAGFHVFINCRESLGQLREVNEEILASGGSCTMLPGDVSDPDSVRAMFRKIASVCDGPDVLVNNAGRAYFGLLSDMTDDDWRQVIDTDLSSAFYCCREAIPYMVSRKQGRIINISSMWGTAGASCRRRACRPGRGNTGRPVRNGRRGRTYGSAAGGRARLSHRTDHRSGRRDDLNHNLK